MNHGVGFFIAGIFGAVDSIVEFRWRAVAAAFDRVAGLDPVTEKVIVTFKGFSYLA